LLLSSDSSKEAGVRVFWSVAFGAALGGISRYYLAGFIQQRAGADFPAGTLIVNITGSFLLGFIMRYALQSDIISPETRVLLTSGFCGGYTTFSTFSYETALLLGDGEYKRAALYVGGSFAFALAATLLGFAAAQRLLVLRQAA
jgi:CrcB protein